MVANASVQLRAQAARLKSAGELGVRRAMIRNLRAAAKPITEDIQDSARESLPKAGGLNEAVANQKPKVAVRATGRTAGVSIRSKVKGNYTNTGQWRHPVFSSDRKRWVKQPQSFPEAKDWWRRGAEKGALPAKATMSRILDEVAAEIVRRGL